jgi:hypothetical protein
MQLPIKHSSQVQTSVPPKKKKEKEIKRFRTYVTVKVAPELVLIGPVG